MPLRRNLANAFETAVRVGKDQSLTMLSADKLMEKAKGLNAAYGGNDTTFVLNVIRSKSGRLGGDRGIPE